ncbi:MAG TPA: lipase family protein [Acidimicrobiales bacterium]|jgi:pimeloyl-ACP methyl ester carboxylesterase
MDTKVRKIRSAARVVLVVVVAFAVAGCVPWYDGTPESFYQLPADATPQPPGTLVRVQEMAGQSTATTTVYRVMYWTKDRRDRQMRATGAVRVPKAAPPTQGTTIAAWDHGTTGVAPQCSPSRGGAGYPSAFLPVDVPVAIPDYIGLGPVGEMHAWLAGVSEARATIDLVRATKALPNVRSNGTWYVAGHSQGGHAALFTAEKAAGYAPELQLRGVIAIAPGTELNEPSYVQTYMKPAAVMVLAGLALDYPEIDPTDYLTPEAESRLGVLETGCLNEIILQYAGLTPLVDVDPWADQHFVDLLVENEPGWAPNPVPVLVLQGGQDIIVPPAFTQEYVQRACNQGTRVKISVYASADHGTIINQSANEARQWLATIAAGQTPPTSC